MLFFIISLLTTACSQTYSLENCETIDPRYSDYCLNCNSGYIRNELYGCIEASDISTNLRNLIENCQDYSNRLDCEKCIEGYNVHEGRCQPICESNCQCFEPNKCTTKHGRKLACTDYDYYCQSCCSYNYDQCCYCNSGYGLDYSYQCVPCLDYTCTSCSTDYTQCEDCLYGYYDSYGNCCSVNNCLDCSSNVGSCTLCESGYSYYDGYCNKCPSNCASCSDDYCSSCKVGYSADGDGGCESTSSRTARVLAMAIAIPIVSFFFLFG